MEVIIKEISECCRRCYRKGFYSKCDQNYMCLSKCQKKHFVMKEFPYQVKKRICTCGRSRRGVGLFCYCNNEEHIFGFDGFGCTQKSLTEDVEVIDCKDLHPQFSKEDIHNHELTCYSCYREKSSGEDCLQKQWNLDNPTVRNLTLEECIDYHKHVLTRKLRSSGKLIVNK
jgi:hypothetical protein